MMYSRPRLSELVCVSTVLGTFHSSTWKLPVSPSSVGSLQLPLVLRNVDSTLSGVIQGTLVLAALIGRGLAERRVKA